MVANHGPDAQITPLSDRHIPGNSNPGAENAAISDSTVVMHYGPVVGKPVGAQPSIRGYRGAGIHDRSGPDLSGVNNDGLGVNKGGPAFWREVHSPGNLQPQRGGSGRSDAGDELDVREAIRLCKRPQHLHAADDMAGQRFIVVQDSDHMPGYGLGTDAASVCHQRQQLTRATTGAQDDQVVLQQSSPSPTGLPVFLAWPNSVAAPGMENSMVFSLTIKTISPPFAMPNSANS